MEPGRVHRIAIAAAVLGGLALVVLAGTAPAYRGTATRATSAMPGPALPVSGPASVAVPQSLPESIGAPPATVETSATLVEQNGLGVLAVAGAPLIVAVAVALLHSVRGAGTRAARTIAWGLTALMLLLALAGALTIGPVILPIALALFVACASSQARHHDQHTPTRRSPHAGALVSAGVGSGGRSRPSRPGR